MPHCPHHRAVACTDATVHPPHGHHSTTCYKSCSVYDHREGASRIGRWFLLLVPESGTHRAAATIAFPLSLQPPKMSTHRAAKLPLLQRYELLADVDVVEQHVHDYGRGTVSPLSRLPHCTLVALAMLAPPVINDLESQNRSVRFPLIWVEGFVPVATATVDRLDTTKPP
jgi:hypothetical protein